MALRICITGAFGNIGAGAARALHPAGHDIWTLTNRTPSAGDLQLASTPLRFDAAHLTAALAGTDVLINTYWVRLASHGATHAEAAANSRTLIDAAVAAGVTRVVQLSVTHASPSSPSPYYAGKATVDAHVRAVAPTWSIIQPTLVVGPQDVLTGNIAWLLRRLPAIMVPGGSMPLQPVLLDDLSRQIADAASNSDNATLESAGPNLWEFRDYVAMVRDALDLRCAIWQVPPPVFRGVTAVAGAVLRDDLVSADELASLRGGSLVPAGPATATGSVAEWLASHGQSLGRHYVNDRRNRRPGAQAARG